MKLRCTTNSIRIRVRKSDLEILKTTGRVEESVGVGNFRFRLEVWPGAKTLRAAFTDGLISVYLPDDQAAGWMNSDQVGMEALWTPDTGAAVQLLVEKDFPCVHTPEEDLDNTFVELSDKSC
jgi:hypothetical protein